MVGFSGCPVSQCRTHCSHNKNVSCCHASFCMSSSPLSLLEKLVDERFRMKLQPIVDWKRFASGAPLSLRTMRILNNTRRTNSKTLKDLCEAAGVPMDDVLNLDDDKFAVLSMDALEVDALQFTMLSLLLVVQRKLVLMFPRTTIAVW